MPRVAVLAALLAAAGPALAAGPYVAAAPEAFDGRVVAPGYCVDFVKAAAGVPRTAEWRPGVKVRGNHHRIPPGTAIATFEADGTYTSTTGNHAAVYVGQDDDGIWVYDQWRRRAVPGEDYRCFRKDRKVDAHPGCYQPVHLRLIRFTGESAGTGSSKSNNGDLFAVIE